MIINQSISKTVRLDYAWYKLNLFQVHDLPQGTMEKGAEIMQDDINVQMIRSAHSFRKNDY